MLCNKPIRERYIYVKEVKGGDQSEESLTNRKRGSHSHLCIYPVLVAWLSTVFSLKVGFQPGAVAHVYNPSTVGGPGRLIT